MKQAILVVSAGTTDAAARQRNIDAVVRCAAVPGVPTFEAWTSRSIRQTLRERGETVEDVPSALRRIAALGVQELVVLPTHLHRGSGYASLCAQLQAAEGLFASLTVAQPLLCVEANARQVLQGLADALPTEDGEALVLLGHPLSDAEGETYECLTALARKMGLRHVFAAAVGSGSSGELAAALRRDGFRRALLTPLMLTAGSHARRGIAADEPQSRYAQLTAAGIGCRTVLRGLGEYEAVLDCYRAQLRRCFAPGPCRVEKET